MTREEGFKDWERYSLACPNDTPIPGTVRLIQLLYEAGYKMVMLSGRNEEAREPTLAWLEKYGIEHDGLILRNYSDDSHKGSNGEFKRDRIREWLFNNPGIKLALMIDDWPAVRDVLATDLNLPTLLVNPAYPEKDEAMELYARQTENVTLDDKSHPDDQGMR